MATVTCEVCGVKPELPAWMRDWYTVRGMSWCPEHKHSVRVGLDGEPVTAMDALWRARHAWARKSMQLELEVG